MNCKACEELRDHAEKFVENGITDTECESLQSNTGLNPNLSELHNNCEDLNDINDCLIGALGEQLPAYGVCGNKGYGLKDYIAKLMKNIYTILKALICSDCGQWKALEALTGNYTKLTKGVDYEIEFYNGYYTTSDDVYVGVAPFGSSMLVRMAGTGSGTWLRNKKLIDTRFRHSEDLNSETEIKSRMYGIKFIGDYAHLNGYEIFANSTTATGVWNVDPDSARATWSGVMAPNVGGTGTYPLVMRAISYMDGFNRQFDYYDDALDKRGNKIDPTIFASEHINHTVEFRLLKK